MESSKQNKTSKPVMPKRTFMRKGAEVILKVDFPAQTLTPKDIIESLESDKKGLQKQHDNIKTFGDQIATANMNIVKTQENIANIEENIKKLEKHEEWTRNIQESRLKALVAEVKVEIEKKVQDSYIDDDTMTPKENDIHRFAEYREYIGRHEKIAKEISATIMRENIYKKGYLDNPFVGDAPDTNAPMPEKELE